MHFAPSGALYSVLPSDLEGFRSLADLALDMHWSWNHCTRDTPIFFAYHGYPSLIHRLTYRRTNHANLHVRGYKEEGTTTTPFDMAVLNDIDRFHLVKDVVDRGSGPGSRAAYLTQLVRDKLIDHKRYIERYRDDMPEVRDRRWGAQRSTAAA